MTDLKLMRGDDETLQIYVYRHNESTGLDDPITAEKAWFTAKRNTRDPDSDAIIALDSANMPGKVQISSGKVLVNIDPADTASCLDRLLLYDLQIRETSGTISTVERGFIQLIGDVTRTIEGGVMTDVIPAGGNVGDVL